MEEFYAHSANSEGQRHKLACHVKEVARLANKFAAGELAYWEGLWHYVRKHHPAFQDYLRKCEAEPGRSHRGSAHKSDGALLTLRNLEPLSFLITGYHGMVIDQGIAGGTSVQ
ncbi:MAG: hypothetical protein JETT_1575 [Candidatus Jettenia ecosi]|uniref:Uncharacterized protein n=1 Tax=Candidatus Jettenia ecosi TaxID=2494326 RepID=A0A533QBR9_9BACT|nr:MAG: hypothetical protein JETT_1575 [Candidatus Jettenia ecosi]